MFTGLIQDVGRLRRIERRSNYRILTIECALPIDQIEIGESIACDGACLTVVERRGSTIVVEASQETVRRTILGDYSDSRHINLERALAVGDRLGGHFVMGHVDAAGLVDAVDKIGDSVKIGISYSHEYSDLVVDKGSIAINGVSLTVNEERDGWLSVNVIPHTIGETTLSSVRSGERVNLEFDILGKYILKASGAEKTTGVTMQKLIESGW